MRDYLLVENGLVYTGQRIVIPGVYQREYLEKIHKGHQGMTKSKLRAKESVYWTNMASDIEDMISNCDVCLQDAPSQKKEPMMSHEIPTKPWDELSSDLFDLKGHTYIVLTDHFSKMLFVRHLTTTGSREVIKFFK